MDIRKIASTPSEYDLIFGEFRYYIKGSGGCDEKKGLLGSMKVDSASPAIPYMEMTDRIIKILHGHNGSCQVPPMSIEHSSSCVLQRLYKNPKSIIQISRQKYKLGRKLDTDQEVATVYKPAGKVTSYRTLATHLTPKLSATVIEKEADLYNKDYILT